MKNPDNSKKLPDFRFNFEEAAGAVGDYGTLIPIVLGVAIVSDVNLGHILLFFSIWYIITGIYFKLPVPIEPMKAIGAIVIAGSLTQKEIAASGIILGVFFFVLGLCKGMKYIQKKVPKSVIRGIQLGLALILIKTSIGYIIEDYVLAIICIIIILIFFVASTFSKIPNLSSIVVLIIGIVVGFFIYGIPSISLMPLPDIIIPTLQDFKSGGWLLALPQAPLTITNAILATSLLFHDTFQRDVNPDKLSKSIGIINLTSVPFGGFPMCHGAGGLAAQFRFGAKTGGSNIISGAILLPIALFFACPQFVSIIPMGVFGALLVFVSLEIGKHGLKTSSYLVTGIIAILALVINFTIAFIIGMALAYLLPENHNRISGFPVKK